MLIYFVLFYINYNESVVSNKTYRLIQPTRQILRSLFRVMCKWKSPIQPLNNIWNLVVCVQLCGLQFTQQLASFQWETLTHLLNNVLYFTKRCKWFMKPEILTAGN